MSQIKDFAPKSLDHFVLLVEDLDAAAAAYRRLGFHVRPKALHEDIGSSNCIIHFDKTYLELIDLTGAREDVAGPYLDRLRLGEGLVHVSFESEGLEGEQARLSDQGYSPWPILNARRAVTLPDGRREETASRSFYLWRDDNRYLSLFFSDHRKPETIFIPEYVDHGSTAREISRCVYVSTLLDADRDYFSACICAEPVEVSGDRLAWRGPRGDLTEILSVDAALRRYGSALPSADPAPLAGVGVALHYAVESISACRRMLDEQGVPVRESDDGDLIVPAADGVGCVTVFEPAGVGMNS